MSTRSPQLHVQLTATEPTVVGSLAVFPLIGETQPSVRYLSFAAAVQHGFLLTELASGASVSDLAVQNPLDTPVLLYEGEEALGAQQNRTFDVSSLIPAKSRLTVPVSCVEAGRWDGARHDEAFSPAPQTANPRLRRMKAEQVRASAAAGAEPRALQGAVWTEVSAIAADHGVTSETSAIHDVFDQRRERLNEIAEQMLIQDDQVGMLAAIGGQFFVLDHVSEPDAYAALHGALLQGYALDSLDIQPADPPSLDDAHDFLALLLRAPLTAQATVGMGDTSRFAFGGLAGSCVRVEDELVALTAYAHAPGPDSRPVTGHVRRPSRRRTH